MTTIALNTYANGDTDYVSKHNADNVITALWLNTFLAGFSSYATNANLVYLVRGIFGSATSGLLDETGCTATIVGQTVELTAGYAWLHSLGCVVYRSATAAANLTGQPDGTYYITMNVAGTPTFNQTGNDALYSVVKTGTSLGSLTTIAVTLSKLNTPFTVKHGGTGVSTIPANQIVMGAGTSAITTITAVNNAALVTNGSGVPSLSTTLPNAVQDNITRLGTIVSGVWNGTVIGAAYGGTGQSSYAVGDLLYASGATTLSKLADVATGNALISGGVTTAPAWGKIGLTTHVSGTLAVGNGGTDITSYAVGDLLYASGATALSKLADVATGNALISGGVTTAPAWGKIGLTTHVSGTLAEGNGGTNQTTYTTGDLLQATGSNTLGKLAAVATGNVLLSGGVGAAASWGKVTNSHIDSAAAIDLAKIAITGHRIPYGNNAGVVTSASTFVFDGTSCGIGTASPVSLLHLAGIGIAGGEATYKGYLTIESGQTDAASNGMELKAANSGSGYGFRFATIYDGASNIDLRFQSRQNSASWTSVLTVAGVGGGRVGIGSSGTVPAYLLDVAGTARINGRLLEQQGTDVASANDLTLNADGNTFEITGTTQINAIITSGWANGAKVTLIFASNPTVKNNTAGGGGTAVMRLAGGADFVASADDTLTLTLSEIGGTQAWREVSRSVN